MSTTELEVYPLSGSSIHGPAPAYERFRAGSPVARVHTKDGVDAWLVTRYEDARALSTDPRLSRAAACGEGAPKVGGTMFTPPEMIVSMDAPEHSRLRKLVAGAFTLRRVEQLRPMVQRVVDELLDEMQAKGSPADLISAMCLPMPLLVIGDLLGVPKQDLDGFGKAARTFATIDESAAEESMAALGQLAGYIASLIAQKRANPTGDILSELIAARDNDDRLSEQELVTFGFTLLGAGFDTTACQIANSVLALIAYHREQWRWLVEDPPNRLESAVEEVLRHVNLFATDTTGFPRVATEDIEVGGVTIKPGDVVLLVLSSANRDEAVFTDAGRLDLARQPNPHLSFGHGMHYCLGKHLARLELEIAFDGLIKRFPDLRLAVPESELVWHHGEINHMVKSLPVQWG